MKVGKNLYLTHAAIIKNESRKNKLFIVEMTLLFFHDATQVLPI